PSRKASAYSRFWRSFRIESFGSNSGLLLGRRRLGAGVEGVVVEAHGLRSGAFKAERQQLRAQRIADAQPIGEHRKRSSVPRADQAATSRQSEQRDVER